MALRLINTPKAAVPAAAQPSLDLTILARARGAVARGDLAAFRACAPDVADIPDAHRRYVARRGLVELGLEAGTDTNASAPVGTLLATAEIGLDALDASPSEPILLNLVGVVLYELGALRGAEPLFRAAAHLDAGLEHVKGNLKAIKRQRKSGTKVKLPASAAMAVPALEDRAAAVARKAQPGEPGRISLCMIVRDEERVLDRCLTSAAGAVDEIIVVDTGSTDRTAEIAREHGARVLEHPWNDDFAEARNVGLDAATGDWILFLDADEVLDAEAAGALRAATARTWREGFRLPIHNLHGSEASNEVVVFEALRLFRSRHRFTGRVHESVLGDVLGEAPERVETVAVRIDHDGYLAHARTEKDKGARNLALLERQLREDGPNAYVHFNIGVEHAGAEQDARALEHFAKAWELLLAQPGAAAQPYAPALAARYAQTLLRAGRIDQAERVANRGLELFPDFTDLLYGRAQLARARGDLDTAEELLQQCLIQGDAPDRYLRQVGAGTYTAATTLAEVLLQRGDAATAESLLRQTLADHPHVAEGRAGLVRALVAQGRFDEAADAADDIVLPDPLTPASFGALVTALEALAGAHRFEAFADLLARAEGVEGVPVRVRREALAGMYLRRGFLDSAAEEWATACDETGPDAAAMAGLAQVAAARGDVEDARMFAQAARELAPAGAR